MKKVFFLFNLLVILACSSEDSSPETDAVDTEPMPSQLTAFAGDDLNVLVESQVSLNGSATGSDDETAYAWQFISKPDGSSTELLNSDTTTPGFLADVPGKYKLELTVSGNNNDTDQITVSAFDVVEINGTFTNLVPGSNVGIARFAIVADRLYATCDFDEIGNIQAEKIACYDGNVWAALGCGLEEGIIHDMIAYQGELYVTGEFIEIGCVPANNIARWDGQNWHEVDGGLTGNDDPAGYTLEVYNSELYVGGIFEMAGNVSAINAAKWNGTEWSAVGTFDSTILEFAVYGSDLYAGGFFTAVDGVNAEKIAFYDGTGWSALGNTEVLELRGTGNINEMAVMDGVLYISGFFNENGNVYSELITWDGIEFKDFGRAFSLNQDNRISELTTINGVLYIGGEFRNVVGSEAGNIMQWDGTQWGILESGVLGRVLSIEEFGNQIYVGGDFTQAGGAIAENMSIWSPN